MNHLWAPWRRELIDATPKAGCIFCDLPAEEGLEADRKNLILGRSRGAFVILNRYPYNNGHLLVVPRRHTSDLARLPTDEADDLHRLVQGSLGVLGEGYHPDGFNLGMNLGRVAGAGVADHLHYHVVPRWGGDTNFLPVVGETKVLIETLDASWERLRAPFDRLLAA